MTQTAFERLGPGDPDSPVVISVPHAGRDYPAALRDVLAVPAAVLATLEDRHLDAVARPARGERTMLIQHLPRAWIDLNRGTDERDPRIDAGAVAGRRQDQSLKLRSGLGLVPRRAGKVECIWRRRFTDADIRHRIDTAHEPYHAALSDLLHRARRRWGIAILLDLHSMPPLSANGPTVVLGDRHGQASHARFVTRAAAEAKRTGLRVALNAPYAGGHILHRHGDPSAGIHAIQLELDRGLYLDARLDQPGPGVGRIAALVRAIADGLAEETGTEPFPAAAE